MEPSCRRMTTRSRAWPETRATVEVNDIWDVDGQRSIRVSGTVIDIGSKGLFLKTEEYVPASKSARITIIFDPESPEGRLNASGEIVRSDAEGVGILFTAIDLGRLQKCIITRLNRGDSNASGPRYRMEPAPEVETKGNVYRLWADRLSGRLRK